MPYFGGKELMKKKTSNAIGSRYRHAEVTGLASFDVKFKSLSMQGFFPDIFVINGVFSKNGFKKTVHP